MALAITTEQEQLADAVTKFAARHAPLDKTRAAFDSIAAGELPSWWEEFTAHGFGAVHIQEESGGQGGTLADMACVVEAAAAALLPGLREIEARCAEIHDAIYATYITYPIADKLNRDQ